MVLPIAAIAIPLLLLLPAMLLWKRCIRPLHMELRLNSIEAPAKRRSTKAAAAARTNLLLNDAAGVTSDLYAEEGDDAAADAAFTPARVWFFIDLAGELQGPCSFDHMSQWLESGSLDPSLRICPASADGVATDDWRALSDIAADIAPADTRSWVFYDHDGNMQGPCPFAHMVVWLEAGSLAPTMQIAPADAQTGALIGAWRALSAIHDDGGGGGDGDADANAADANADADNYQRSSSPTSAVAKVVVCGTDLECSAAAAEAPARRAIDAGVVADDDCDIGDDDFEKPSSRRSMFAKRRSTRRASTAVYANHFASITAASSRFSFSTAELRSSSEAATQRSGGERGSDVISMGVLRSILPPGIKQSDLDRMLRKFGTLADADSSADSPAAARRQTSTPRGLIAMHRHKRQKGIAKRQRQAQLRALGRLAGEWQRHVDLKKGEIYYVHSRTLERRETPPPQEAAIEMTESPIRARRSIDSSSSAPGGEQRAAVRSEYGTDMTVNPVQARLNIDSSVARDGAGANAVRTEHGTKMTVNPSKLRVGTIDDALATERLSDTKEELPEREEYHLDSKGFARLQRYLENQRVVIAIVTTLVITVYFMYMRVTVALINVWSRVKINGVWYLSQSLDLESNTPDHIIAQVLSAFWIAGFSLGAPLLGFGLLAWLFRTGRENDPRWRTAIGFLNDGYRREYFWWEAAVLARKLLLLLVAVVLSPDDGFLQAFAAICVLSVAMVLQAWIQPYESVLINVLDMAAMGAVYVSRLGAILYSHFDPLEPNLQTDCDAYVDCRGFRESLASWIGFVLIGMQVVLVLGFGAALLKEKLAETKIAQKVWHRCCSMACVQRMRRHGNSAGGALDAADEFGAPMPVRVETTTNAAYAVHRESARPAGRVSTFGASAFDAARSDARHAGLSVLSPLGSVRSAAGSLLPSGWRRHADCDPAAPQYFSHASPFSADPEEDAAAEGERRTTWTKPAAGRAESEGTVVGDASVASAARRRLSQIAPGSSTTLDVGSVRAPVAFEVPIEA